MALANATVALHSEFRKNHKLKLNTGKVRFGRSPSLSHVFEREVASNLSEIYPEYLFLVDYPISLYDSNDKYLRTLYFDNLIIKGIDIEKRKTSGTLVGILDLKIDLGYVDLREYGYDDQDLTKILASSEFSKREELICSPNAIQFNYVVNAHSETEKQQNRDIGKLKVKIPPKFKKIAIVCTQHNDHRRSESYSNALRENGYEILFLLDQDCHPNRLDDLSKKIKKQIMGKSKEISSMFEF
jgi:hypothetical protein